MKYHLISDDLPIFSKFLNANFKDIEKYQARPKKSEELKTN
jgi:hypothetical protein